MTEAYMHVMWDAIKAAELPWWFWCSIAAFIIGINCGEPA